ncbi:hypothetical protein [Clostridium acetobutylicum]|nr:hypothetical protein [Clostridium acetobutylicum]NYC93954.1 uncharacterized protein YlxW (UPF0749 family) [Clostridium acetobutylicum]
MKKFGAQIGVAFVCCILGFMIAHQLKIVSFSRHKTKYRYGKCRNIRRIE